MKESVLWIYFSLITAKVFMLRLVTGVVLEVVAFVFIGVEVVLGKMFSGSESEFSRIWRVTGFVTAGAISVNIPFWFLAKLSLHDDLFSWVRFNLIEFLRLNFGRLIRNSYVVFSLIILN